jgi:hypothetical protein
MPALQCTAGNCWLPGCHRVARSPCRQGSRGVTAVRAPLGRPLCRRGRSGAVGPVVATAAQSEADQPCCRGRGGRSSAQISSSSAIPTVPPHLPLGWSSTTLDADTPHLAASRQPADCHQPSDRVHLGSEECLDFDNGLRLRRRHPSPQQSSFPLPNPRPIGR